jgi:hypothetical protein
MNLLPLEIQVHILSFSLGIELFTWLQVSKPFKNVIKALMKGKKNGYKGLYSSRSISYSELRLETRDRKITRRKYKNKRLTITKEISPFFSVFYDSNSGFEFSSIDGFKLSFDLLGKIEKIEVGVDSLFRLKFKNEIPVSLVREEEYYGSIYLLSWTIKNEIFIPSYISFMEYVFEKGDIEIWEKYDFFFLKNLKRIGINYDMINKYKFELENKFPFFPKKSYQLLISQS